MLQVLGYVLVNGTVHLSVRPERSRIARRVARHPTQSKGDLLYEGPDHQQAIASLREKYPQYRTMDLDTNPVIRITPTNIIRWGHPSG